MPDQGGLPSKPETTGTNSSREVTDVETTQITRKGWLQILSTFIVFFNTWGLLLTFGVFQTHYEQTLLRGHSSSSISWISTTAAFLTLSAGVLAGPAFDHGFYRVLLLFGTNLQIFGLMMVSLSDEYYQLFLSQSICTGVGAGLAFTPSVAAAAKCLTKPATRAKAMGLMACGSSIGGIIYPVMFRFLVPQIGFPWTVRSIGFVAWGLYMISYVVLLGWQPEVATRRRFFDSSVLTDLPFLLLCTASVCSATAYYIPSLYLPLLTYERIPSANTSLGFDLLAILNGASVVGRLVAGFVAAVVGPTETITVCLVFGSVLLFCWSVVDTVAGTIAWSVFWGMISGVLVALPGAFIPLFCPSMAVVGTRSGMYWVFVGLGMLIGSPIGGAIHNKRRFSSRVDGGGWQLQVFAGIFMMTAAVLMLYPIMHLRKNKMGGR